MREQVVNQLQRVGYEVLQANYSNVEICYQGIADGSYMHAVILIDQVPASHMGRDQYAQLKSSVQRLFAGRGCSQLELLTIVYTNEVIPYRIILEGEPKHWIINVETAKLEINEDSPCSFPELYRIVLDPLEKEKRGPDGKKRSKDNFFKRNRPAKRRVWSRDPVMCIILAALNILAFILLELTGSTWDISHMVRYGALQSDMVIQNGEYYRMFTSMFMHFGIGHLMGNMFGLLTLGAQVERIVGKWKFLAIYLIGGLCGSGLTVYHDLVMNEYIPAAGASGAIYAVMGALAVIIITRRGYADLVSIGGFFIYIILNIYNGFMDVGIGGFAHFGGLIGGAVVYLLLAGRRRGD